MTSRAVTARRSRSPKPPRSRGPRNPGSPSKSQRYAPRAPAHGRDPTADGQEALPLPGPGQGRAASGRTSTTTSTAPRAAGRRQATNTRMVFSAGSRGARVTTSSGPPASPLCTASPSLKGTVANAATGRRREQLRSSPSPSTATTSSSPGRGPCPRPVVDGSRALYPEIFPGADLVLTADDDGFAQLIVLKNRQAAADPRVQQLTYGITSASLIVPARPGHRHPRRRGRGR